MLRSSNSRASLRSNARGPLPTPVVVGSPGAGQHQMLSRLHAVGPAVLDGYKAMVDQWIPSFSSYLPTYRLLPATIRGMVWVPDGEHGIGNMTHFEWRIDPARRGRHPRPDGSWSGTPNDVASRMKTDFEAVREMVLVRRQSLLVIPGRCIYPLRGPRHLHIDASFPPQRDHFSTPSYRELKWCKSNLRAPMDEPHRSPELRRLEHLTRYKGWTDETAVMVRVSKAAAVPLLQGHDGQRRGRTFAPGCVPRHSPRTRDLPPASEVPAFSVESRR